MTKKSARSTAVNKPAKAQETVKTGQPDLKNAARAKLHSSGLTEEDGKKLRIQLYTAQQVASKFPTLPAHIEGLQIPYFDLDGAVTKFWRFRYLGDTRKGFEKLTTKKPIRYVQLKGSVNELYLPPLLKGRSWRKVAENAEQPIIITEGELKAACACKHLSTPTLGLGGVWCFKSNSNHLPLLPQFKEFKWKGRVVYVIYDSDAAHNPDVTMAENALCRALTAEGAEPSVVRLPAGPGGAKQGLDDYILSSGASALDELLEEAVPWRAAQELYALNEEVVYIRNPGIILVLDNLQRISPRAFVEHAYSTRIYYEEQVTEKGTKLVEKCAPKEWLRWPQRAAAERVTYAPGQPRMYEGQLNVWPGWAVQPIKGDVSLWTTLLDYLFLNEKRSRAWLERWFACGLQQPGVKQYTSPLIWGRHHGTGKSLLGYTMFRIYGTNATEIESRNLHESHNEWAENKQFVMGDEISGEDKRDVGNRMKSIITRQQLRLNPKYVPSYTVPDCINYYFTSNHPDSWFLEDKDRRYFIHEVVSEPLPLEFYQAYHRALYEDPENRFASALFYHLLNLDLGDFDPRAPAPMTAAKQEMIDYGRSDVGSWCAHLKRDPDSVLKLDNKPIPYKFWRSEELIHIYDPAGRGRVTVNGLSRELRRAGFERFSGVVTSEGQVNLWKVRETEETKGIRPVDAGKLYDAERALPKAKPEKF